VLARVSLSEDMEEAVETLALKDREGRYGGLFGSAVHYAIGVMLRSSGQWKRPYSAPQNFTA
jgi:hypothetical protein